MSALDRRPGVTYWALVPNLKGAQLADDGGVGHLTFTVSASPEYNQRNVGMAVDDSIAELARITSSFPGREVDAVVSCAFGSPYEGDIDEGAVAALGDRLLDAGASSLTYADTTGMATPRRVEDLVENTGHGIGLHLHETRGTGLVNAFAAVRLGVARFDTSVGGLGGSPFAAGAAGNLATEDLVHLLDDLGHHTGIDLERLLRERGFIKYGDRGRSLTADGVRRATGTYTHRPALEDRNAE
jgi:hydroxymethylglutaryl-CoA lyase